MLRIALQSFVEFRAALCVLAKVLVADTLKIAARHKKGLKSRRKVLSMLGGIVRDTRLCEFLSGLLCRNCKVIDRECVLVRDDITESPKIVAEWIQAASDASRTFGNRETC